MKQNTFVMSLVLTVFLLSAFLKATAISDCTNLTSAGETYVLTTDITDSSAVTCMNVGADSIVLDCQGHTIDGDNYNANIGIHSVGYNSLTIKNCTITNYTGPAIYLDTSTGSNITDINAYLDDMSIYITASSGNSIANINATSNIYGIYSDTSSDNNFTNIVVNSNFFNGIILNMVSNNIFKNVTADSNEWGIGLYYVSSNNIFYNSVVSNSTDYGIYIYQEDDSLSENNTFYNNLLNNSVNFYECKNDPTLGDCNSTYDLSPYNPTNYLNTTNQLGTRIYSSGTNIGGNYWTNPSSTGYSDTCADANSDGFCDSSYIIALTSVDYLPLSNNYSSLDDEISDCANLTSAGETYLLNTNITDNDSYICMNIQADNITLNCQGNTIDGIGTELSKAIYSQDVNGITVENCVTTDWHFSLFMNNTNTSTIEFNDFKNSTNNAMVIAYGSSGNTIDNNVVDGIIEAASGMTYYYADNNNIYENNITSGGNAAFGMYFINCNNDTVHENRISDLFDGGIAIDLVDSGDTTPLLIYNNLLNSTFDGVWIDNGSAVNYWNTTQQAGTRIYSPGTDIGGNYYANPTGNGYSEICEANIEGFCNAPKIVHGGDENNYDYLALSFYDNDPITDCAVLNKPGAYNLTSNIGASATSACITISADNIILDCQGYSIIGNGSQGCNDYYSVGQYAGIFSDGFSNITIKNCQVSDWGDAIVLANGDNITIFNLTSSNNNCGDTYGGTFIQLANVNDSHFYNFTSNADYCGFVCGGGNCHYNVVENGSITSNNMCSAVSWNAGDTNNNVSNVNMNLTQTYPDMAAIFIGGGSIDNLFSNNIISLSIDPGQNIHYVTFEWGDGDINNWNDSFRGNYWTNLTGNGYSDICADANYDGICDQPFDLITETTCTVGVDCSNNTDFLPLSNQYTPLNLGFSVTWDAPANNSVLTNGNVDFNFTPIWYDVPMTYCEVSLNGLGNTVNATPLINGTSNMITWSNLSDADYVGYIECFNGTDLNISDTIYFTVNTTTLNLGFSVSLDHPANNTVSTNPLVDFGFIPVWYDSPLDVCGLYLNGSWAADNSTPLINNSVMNTISYDFTGMDGPWEYYIICQNSTAGNQTGLYNLVVDTQPPSQVPGFTNDSAGYTWIHLVWNASSDTGTGLSNYVLYENGVWIGNTTGLSANDTMLAANTTYTYDLSACDYAGNCAANSTIFASTLAIPPTPPSPPVGGGGYTPPSTTGNATQNPPALGISGTPGSDLFSIANLIILVLAILVLAYFANKRK